MKKRKKEYYGDVRFEFEYADQYSSKAIDILRNSNSRKKQSSVKDIIYAPYILAEQVKSIKNMFLDIKDYHWDTIGKNDGKK